MDLVERLRNAAHNAEALASVGTDAAGVKLDSAQKIAQRAGAALEREAADEVEKLRGAIVTAYGHLWRVLTPGSAEIMARKALLAVMTPEEQRAAIAAHGQPLQGRISSL